MAVRRLHSDQPAHFAFTPENHAWAKAQIAKFPQGKQAAAIIPLFWRAQEQAGWLSEPAIRAITDMLGMAHIRGLEVATFYTMFQLSPVGTTAHVQVCGTTPCMLRGSGALIETCKNRIHHDAHHVSADGKFSWEEVECMGTCANAPMVQVNKDTYEDLTPAALEAILDMFAAGETPVPGSQTGRKASCPAGGPTTLTDSSLYDGSGIGAWRKRFEDTGAPAHVSAPASSPATSPQVTAAAGVAAGASASTVAPAINPAALTAMANAGLVKELNERGGGMPMSAGELARLKMTTQVAPLAAAQVAAVTAAAKQTSASEGDAAKPELLSAPRGGKGDELGLIWGVGDKLAEKMNAMGIWHFDQIAKWTEAHVAWFETEVPGFKGRIVRDKWIEQCVKLASGWRPGSDVGERPKG
ncbi:MAG: NADH-quinone oxidoreductase subunit NuoE [Hyphomicrobium sp.]